MGSATKKIIHAIQAPFFSNKRKKRGEDRLSERAIEKHVEMLRDLPWLSLLDDKNFQKVIAGFKCRKFQEGTTLLKEDDPDNGMFVIVEGRVRIKIRGISMNELGSGSLIGEMSVLTGYPRSATVVAVTPVQVVWIETATLKSIMKKSAVLENGLWEYASRRFAMNLLGRNEPYNQWEQNIFIQWIAAGEIKVPDEHGLIDLKNKVGVLVTGTATMQDGSAISATSSLMGSDYIFSKEARVFIRSK